MYKTSTSAGPGPALMGADTLIGDSVVNGNEEDLGDIKEIMLDMNTGQVAYAVLAFGGFLGMGEKLFAVPWQALHLDTVNKRFVLSVDKDRLKTAPGFNPDAWPDMSDVSWSNQIHSFYGTDPSRSSGPTMGPGSTLSGMTGGTGTGMGAGAAGMGTGSAGSMGGAGTSSSMGAGSSSSAGGSAGTAGSTGTVSNAGISSGSGSSTTGSGSAGMGTGSGLGGSSGAGTGAGSGLDSSSSTKSGSSGSDI
jgi:sporulation protein YlmC with PRC-barrel domain